MYSHDEFRQYYELDTVIETDPGKDTSANDVARGNGSAAKPVPHDVIPETSSDEEPVSAPATTFAVAASSANDIASASGSAAKPGQHDISHAASSDDPVPPPVLFTVDDLEGTVPCLGGKKACEEQRKLRKMQLASNTPHAIVDVTRSDFNWKAMLKSLPTGRMIIGCGVTALNFRLLPHVRDHNYMKIDSGEKHVFEIVRADASRVLLHFKKKGRCDPPEVIAAPERNAPIYASQSDHAGSLYRCRPAITHRDIASTREAGDRSAPLGRAEATIALESLLIASFGKSDIGALNLTDGCAFPWMRFLRNSVQCKEYAGPGIEAVYAARYYEGDAPVLLLCRADGSYVEMRPAVKQSLHEIVEGKWVEWQKLDILKDAKYISQSWLQVRNNLTL